MLAGSILLAACTPTSAHLAEVPMTPPTTNAVQAPTTTAAAATSQPPTTTTEVPVFRAEIEIVTAEELGASWRPGCPVEAEEVRRLELTHWTMEGDTATGRLDVHADVAAEVVAAFESLFELRFPIERMTPVDAYDADDDRSMAANNTSGLNCRPIAGTSSWSQHAYGLAIDLNPVQNPWIPGEVHPPAGSAYLDRSEVRPGMITEDVIEAFTAVDWGWGGRWSPPDYHHFSKTGR